MKIIFRLCQLKKPRIWELCAHLSSLFLFYFTVLPWYRCHTLPLALFWKETLNICLKGDLSRKRPHQPKKNPNFPYLHPHYMDSLDPLDPLCFEEAWFPQCDIHLPSVCIEDFLMQLGFLKLQWLGEWLVPVWKWLLHAILQLLFSPFYKIPLRLISERDKEGHREDLRSFQHCIQYWWL